MNCPACGNVNLVMSERQGIEIDYCPQCRGVWLDRGELDKIIEKSSSQSAAPEQRGYTEQPKYQERSYKSDDRDYYHKKKKKNFLSDIFDF